MRPGSYPRHPLSPPEPSRSMRQAISAALPIVLALILLPTLAFASPPDPSWVAGFYDGADGDEIVSLVYETSAANHTALSHLGPLPCLLEISLEGIVCNIPDRHFTRGPRSPPILFSGVRICLHFFASSGRIHGSSYHPRKFHSSWCSDLR